MEFTWSERKRAANRKLMASTSLMPLVSSSGTTYAFEDDRFSYGEQGFVTVGLLAGVPVSIVHTETDYEIRVISFRKATNREAEIYFNEVQN